MHKKSKTDFKIRLVYFLVCDIFGNAFQDIDCDVSSAELAAFIICIVIEVNDSGTSPQSPAGIACNGIAVDDLTVIGYDIEDRAIGDNIGIDSDNAVTGESAGSGESTCRGIISGSRTCKDSCIADLIAVYVRKDIVGFIGIDGARACIDLTDILFCTVEDNFINGIFGDFEIRRDAGNNLSAACRYGFREAFARSRRQVRNRDRRQGFHVAADRESE